MLGPFSIDTYLPAFPAIGASFHATPLQVQQTLTAYMVMFAFMTLWHGAISDAIGRRRVILVGLGGYVFASLFCAFSTRIEMLWLGRAMQGMVGGVGFIVGRAVIRDLYDGPQAQRLMANVALIFAIAPAIAPIIGGQLQHWFNWHGVFFFLALLASAIGLMCFRQLPETLPREKRQPFSPSSLWQGYREIFGSAQFICLSLALTANFAGFFVYVLSSPVFIIQHLKLSPESFAAMFVPAVCGMMLGSLYQWPSGRAVVTTSHHRTGFWCDADCLDQQCRAQPDAARRNGRGQLFPCFFTLAEWRWRCLVCRYWRWICSRHGSACRRAARG